MSALAEKLAQAVMTRCDDLATCSEEAGCTTRRFLSEPMHEVHERLARWMSEAELESRVDDAGNIIGRRAATDGAPVLILGSHLDSVPGAGRYDGVLGVLIALAVAEAIGDRQLPFHLDVMGFSEEEGVRYSLPYLGSHAVAGSFERTWLDRIDAAGISMGESIRAFQLDPERIVDAAYACDEVLGYVEPHLEQGPLLERGGLPVAVVAGIAGQSRLRLRFVGEAGHVGTTPMQGRRDALVMAANFIREVQTIGQATPELRATVGRVDVEPNAPNVIASQVELSLDVRHLENQKREQAINALLATGQRIAAEEQGSFEVVETLAQPAVAMDDRLSDTLTKAVKACDCPAQRICSGAGHDAVVMAKKFPTAMLFLRHPGGVSHHPDERVETADVAVAIDVLLQFVLQLAAQHQHQQASLNK